MKIILAKNAGFCFGVKKAMSTIKENIGTKNMYTLGPVIHNRDVIKMLEDKGVFAVDSIDKLKNGDTVVIRSHGEPESTYKKANELGVKIIDVTCPYVKKIHDIAAKSSLGNRMLVIIGQAEHAEVLGIAGWTNNSVVLETEEEVKEFINNNSYDLPITVVSQTTQKEDAFKSISELLIEYFTYIEIFDTICSTTKNRQEEAISLAKEADVVIVIGGNHSANTQKLYELCLLHCSNTYKIESVRELPLEKISNNDIISIVAGASTPDWLIREVIDTMEQLDNDCSNADGVTEETVNNSQETEVQEKETEVQETENTENENVKTDTTATQEKDNDKSEALNTDADFVADYEKTFTPLKTGMLVKGTVVQVTNSDVCLNIGYKSDGIISKKDFGIKEEESLKDKIKVGDIVEAEIVKLNDGEGNVLLTRKNLLADETWINFVSKMESSPTVECIGKEAVKGGLITMVEGFRVFIPASLLDVKYVEDIGMFVGKPLSIKIVEIDKEKKRAIGSRKEVLLDEAKMQKEEKWEAINEGDVVKGKVMRITDFGVFVDINGLDGMIHVSDLAWFRVNHPSDIVSIGQTLEVRIVSIDKEKNKIGLSLKHMFKKPWDTAEEKYAVGSIVTGTVARIAPFGAFIELEQGIDGLLHISQISLNRVNKVEDVLKIGDKVTVKIIEVDGAKKRISLSIKEILKDEEAAKEPKEPIEEDDYTIPPIEENRVTIGDILRQQEEDEKK